MVKCKCGCGNIVNNNGKFILGHQNIYNYKGKTWEQIYGIDGAKQFREKRRKTRLGKKINRKKPNYKKGKTAEQIYGKEKLQIIIKKSLETKLKNKTIWSKDRIINAYLNIENIRKNEWVKLRKQGILPDRSTVNKFFGTIDKLISITNKPFLENEKRRKHKGFNEDFILDNIEKENNIKLERQSPIIINKNKFFIDGYDKINNVVYEIYEPYHKYNRFYDEKREILIKEKLNCNFIKIDEQKILKENNFGDLENVKFN